jgi:tetratricopeptide (TPR) repeat protein
MLSHDSLSVRKVASVALGLIGDRRQVSCLVQVLRDHDASLSKMAEHSLWSIWCRAGRTPAQKLFRQGMAVLGTDRAEDALDWFDQALDVDGKFAEVHHQRAIAMDMLERWPEAISSCKKTLELEPNHFGAWATLGHCFALTDQLEEAARCYRRAVDLNPHMNQIAFALTCLKTLLDPSATVA